MDRSPLATLPRELRDEIWLLALKQDGVINLICRWVTVLGGLDPKAFQFARSPNQHRYPLALTTICKQIQYESGGLFFKNNTFSFDLDHFLENDNLLYISSWTKAVGDKNVQAIKRALPGQLAQSMGGFVNHSLLWTFSLTAFTSFEDFLANPFGDVTFPSNTITFMGIPLDCPGQTIKASLVAKRAELIKEMEEYGCNLKERRDMLSYLDSVGKNVIRVMEDLTQALRRHTK